MGEDGAIGVSAAVSEESGDVAAADDAKRSDGIGDTSRKRSALHAFTVKADVPEDSLEESLLRLERKMPGQYPASGPFKGSMRGFIDSCKIAVQDIIASGTQPEGVNAADVFALHLYTRAELFGEINRAFRDGKADEIAKWQTAAWHICAAKRRVRALAGVVYRGVSKLFKFVPLTDYKPGKVITWSAFSSCSDDLRIATKFMYGQQDPSKTEGAIFKIYTKSGAPIWWCSFAPHERELLFLPNTSFKVLNWYPATQVNLSRGRRTETSGDKPFVLNCDAIVHPEPLQHVNTDDALRKQLVHNQVLLVEMEEVELPAEEEYEEAHTALFE
eukprot:6195247-Pleurochrysis_carterae.AAC.1